jgi:hypothetical protein
MILICIFGTMATIKKQEEPGVPINLPDSLPVGKLRSPLPGTEGPGYGRIFFMKGILPAVSRGDRISTIFAWFADKDVNRWRISRLTR